jgi:hypothetical protein
MPLLSTREKATVESERLIREVSEKPSSAFPRGAVSLFFVFALSLAYWTYLFFATEMLAKFDAYAYEWLGKMIYEKGWGEFFRSGPHREPFYPFMISLAMRIGDSLSISYHWIQKLFQVLFLLASQILTLQLLRELRIRGSLQCLTLLYVGFSPSIVGSSFSLFSEISSLPFVPAMILAAVASWKSIPGASLAKVMGWGAASGALALLATMTRGIFQHVFYVSLIPFLFLLVSAWRAKTGKVALNILAYLCAALLIVQPGVVGYKLANKIHNGKYQLTDRYANLLYGNASKRARELTPRILLMHLASIPGYGVCRAFFSASECEYCQPETIEGIQSRELGVLLQGVPEERQNARKIELAGERFLEKPLHYLLFMLIESARMFFWESTQLAFVQYPAWLKGLFDFGPLRNGLRLVVSALTFAGVAYLASCVLGSLRERRDPGLPEPETSPVGLFMLLAIAAVIGLYSLFTVVPRYGVPIAPLYLASIALMAEHALLRRTKGPREVPR